MFNNIVSVVINLKDINIFSEIFLCIAAMYFLFFFTFIRVLKKNISYNPNFLLSPIILILLFSICLILNLDRPFLNSVSFNNSIVTDYVSFCSKLLIGFSSIIYFLSLNSFFKKHRTGSVEYLVLILLAILGIYLLCSANDLLTTYLAIELQSLSFYLMASFNNYSLHSVESGLKYFIMGSLSSALFLFGSSIFYGFTGSLCFEDFKDLFSYIFSENCVLFILGSKSILNALEVYENKSEFLDNKLSTLRLIDQKFKILKRYTVLSPENVSLVCKDSLHAYQFGEQKFLSHLSFAKRLHELIVEHDRYFREPIYNERFNRVHHKTDDWQIVLSHVAACDAHAQLSAFVYEPSSKHYLRPAFSLPAEQTIQKYGFAWFLENGPTAHSNRLSKNAYHFFKFNPDNFSEYKNLQPYPFARFAFEFCAASLFNSLLFLEPNGIEDSHKHMYLLADTNLIILGLLLILTSIFIKIALSPFHTWSIDVYEGSPTSSTFFFAIISKFSLFVLLIRLCYGSFNSFSDFWQIYSIAFAVVSIITGAVAAVSQRKLKSLLAYSSISHMGFVLLAFSSNTFEGVQMLICYLVIYTVAGLCLWSSILALRLVKSDALNKHNKDLGELSLLRKSNPILSLILMGCLLSIAGTPPMAGFIAKMGVFLTAVGSAFYLVALVLFLVSVISTFYYLRIIQVLYFENILVGKLYYPILNQNFFVIPLMFVLLLVLFFDPTFLYLISYKTVLLFFYS